MTNFVVIPVRLGFQTVPTMLYNSYTEYDDSGDDVVEISTDEYYSRVEGVAFSVGAGLIFQRLAFDFTFLYSQYKQCGDSNLSGYSWSKKGYKLGFSMSAIFYF